MLQRSMPFLISVPILLAAPFAVAQPAPPSAPEAPSLDARLAAVLDAPGGLDARAVADRARAASTAGLRADAEVARAAAKRVEVDRAFVPRVGVTARYTRLSETDPTVIDGLPIEVAIPGPVPNQLAAGVSLGLPVSDWFLRLPVAQEASARGEVARRAQAEVARRRAALEAVLAYYQWARTRLVAVVAEAGLEDARAHLTAAERLARAELASPADVKLAEAGVARASLGLDRARHGEALLAEQLRRLLDLPDGAPLAIGEDLTVPPFAVGDAPSGPEALSEALRARPESRALAALDAALAAERDVAGMGRLPRLDVVANLSVSNPSPRGLQNEDETVVVWDASAVLSWSLGDLLGADTVDRDVAARERGVAADREALADGVALELEAARAAIRDADSAATASAVELAAAEEAFRVRTRLFALGKATSLELTDAETALTSARLGVVDARIARREGEARLAHALGR
ncbi:MAG: TolC family protein [Deltaproteobacteria bacterium]|nr:TolC family protein [Deltaproteobacteria bacterium]